MTPDLEHDIRTALEDRVERVTADRLLHIDAARPATRRTPRTRWAIASPIAAAACVGLIAVIVTVVASGRDSSGTPAGGTGRNLSLSSLIGTSWRLAWVQQDGHSAVAIPQRLSASVTFEREGVFSAQDSVNYYQATYELTTGDDMIIAGAGGTLAVYAGNDPARLAAINGIRAILYTGDGQTTAHAVAAQHRSDQLQLTANGYTLVLGGEVPVANSSAPPPSSTTSK